MNLAHYHDLNSEFCLRLTLTLLHFLWQGVAVALLALAAGAAARRAGAAARYWVLVAALVVMALCPPVTFLSLAPKAGSRPLGHASANVMLSPNKEAGSGMGSPAAGPSMDPLAPGIRPVRVENAPAGSRTLKERLAALIASDSCRRAAPWVAAGYFAGVLLMLARLLLALRGGRGLRRHSKPVMEPMFLSSLQRAAAAVRLQIVPALAWCWRVAVPTVVGILKPTILLPLTLSSGLAPDQVEMLLLHELAHLRRRDHWVNLVQWVIEAALFFHPAVWWLSRRIRAERELACDDMVLAAGVGQAPYAESLLRMAELSRAALTPAPGAALALGSHGPRRSAFGQRILRLIEGREALERVRPARIWPLALALALMIALFGCYSLGFKVDGKRWGINKSTAVDNQDELRLVAWTAIVDEPLANLLKQQTSPIPGKETYQCLRINSDALMDALKAAPVQDRVLATAPEMIWPDVNRKFPGDQILPYLITSNVRPLTKDLIREYNIITQPFYKYSRNKRGLHWEWHGKGRADLEHVGTQAVVDGSRASVDGEFKFSGDLAIGDGVIFLAPMGKEMQWSPWHLIVLQAVAVPGRLGQDVQSIDTDQWIAWGVKGSIARLEQSRAWEKEAAVPNTADGQWSHVTPDGGVIRIVAVGQPARWPMRWWNAGGGAVERSPFWDKHTKDTDLAVVIERSGVDGVVNFDLPLAGTLKSGQGLTAGSDLDVPGGQQVILTMMPSSTYADRKIIKDWQAESKPFDVEVAYGVGVWEEVGVIREGETRTLTGGTFSLEKVDPRNNLPRQGQVLVKGSYTADPAVAVALVGVDRQGRRSAIQSGTSGGSRLFNRERKWNEFIPMDKQEIDHFLILRRPVRTHVFNGITPVPRKDTVSAGSFTR